MSRTPKEKALHALGWRIATDKQWCDPESMHTYPFQIALEIQQQRSGILLAAPKGLSEPGVAVQPTPPRPLDVEALVNEHFNAVMAFKLFPNTAESVDRLSAANRALLSAYRPQAQTPGAETRAGFPDAIYLDRTTRRWYTPGESNEHGPIEATGLRYEANGSTPVQLNGEAHEADTREAVAKIVAAESLDADLEASWRAWCPEDQGYFLAQADKILSILSKSPTANPPEVREGGKL